MGRSLCSLQDGGAYRTLRCACYRTFVALTTGRSSPLLVSFGCRGDAIYTANYRKVPLPKKRYGNVCDSQFTIRA